MGSVRLVSKLRKRLPFLVNPLTSASAATYILSPLTSDRMNNIALIMVKERERERERERF